MFIYFSYFLKISWLRDVYFWFYGRKTNTIPKIFFQKVLILEKKIVYYLKTINFCARLIFAQKIFASLIFKHYKNL